MKILIKIGLIALGVLAVITLAGYFIISSYLTPERLRMTARQIASEAIQRPVEIGRVSLKFGLKIGISVDSVTIANSPAFSSTDMATLKNVTLNLKLLPLLRRQIVIGGINLQGVSVELEKNRAGKTNFDLVPAQEGKGTSWELSLSDIRIRDGSLRYRDGTGLDLQVKDIDQRIGFGPRGSITARGEQTAYLLKTKDLPEIIVTIANDIAYDTSAKNLQVKTARFTYDPFVVNLSGTIEHMERLQLTASARFDALARALPLIPASGRPRRLDGSARVDVNIMGTLEEPKVDGRCAVNNVALGLAGTDRDFENINGSFSFDANAIKNLLIQGSLGETKIDLSGAVTNLNDPKLDLILKVTGDLKSLENLTPEMKGMTMSGPLRVTCTVKGTGKKPAYYGDLSITDATVNGIGLAQPIANLRLKGNLQNDVVRVSECSGHIGRSDFALTGTISDLAQPSIQIANSSNVIDLDELLPAKNGTPASRKQQGIPLTIKGTMKVNKLTGMDLEFRNVTTGFGLEKGIVDIKNCNAETFDGKVVFDFYYDFNSPEPYRINTRMTNISTKQLLTRFLKFSNLEARLTGVSNFQGKGLGQKDVIANMTASGNLKLTGGTFKNFPFFTALFGWLGFKSYDNVPLKDMVCYYRIENGKTKVQDWALTLNSGNLLVNGTIGLNGNTDLDLTLTLNKTESELLKKHRADWVLFYDKSGRAVIDIVASGKLLAPQFRLDKDKIAQRLKGKIKDEFDERKGDWEKKLKDLFGR